MYLLTSRRPPVVLQEIVREELCRIRRLRSAERDKAGRECGREGLRHVLLRLLRGGERLDQPVGKEELELAEGRRRRGRPMRDIPRRIDAKARPQRAGTAHLCHVRIGRTEDCRPPRDSPLAGEGECDAGARREQRDCGLERASWRRLDRGAREPTRNVS